MHGLDCIHGDLKSVRYPPLASLSVTDAPSQSNILVNGDHSAVLANFRLASFLPESEVNTGILVSECDPWSVRWHAPELLFPEKFGLDGARRTKETDVYAFAMVMYEVSPLFVFVVPQLDLTVTPHFWLRNECHRRYLDHFRSRASGTKH
jgi:serine/threonine protein kinase